MEFAYVYLLRCNKKIEEYTFEDDEVSEVKYVLYKDLEKMVEEKAVEEKMVEEKEVSQPEPVQKTDSIANRKLIYPPKTPAKKKNSLQAANAKSMNIYRSISRKPKRK